MLKIKRLTDVIGQKVYTDQGEIFGFVEEVNLIDNRIEGWRIVVSRESEHSNVLGGARGIIVPHNFIKAIGNIVLISSNAIPLQKAEEEFPMDDDLI